jgi:hypothetical protein
MLTAVPWTSARACRRRHHRRTKGGLAFAAAVTQPAASGEYSRPCTVMPAQDAKSMLLYSSHTHPTHSANGSSGQSHIGPTAVCLLHAAGREEREDSNSGRPFLTCLSRPTYPRQYACTSTQHTQSTHAAGSTHTQQHIFGVNTGTQSTRQPHTQGAGSAALQTPSLPKPCSRAAPNRPPATTAPAPSTALLSKLAMAAQQLQLPPLLPRRAVLRGQCCAVLPCGRLRCLSGCCRHRPPP